MMTQPDDAHRGESQASMAPQDRLRKELLTSGLYDWVPLAEVDSIILDNHLTETLSARQDLALRTIRSLVADGLMEIGDLPSQGSRLAAWNVSLDAALARVSDRFVGHYDDTAMWGFSIWLGLTDAGERVARDLEGKTAD
jgi:protein involved in temperature-dependent protein secretion